MWFWWFLFFCDLLVPVTMIVAGRIMWKHYPKQINQHIGYRTRRSMKNMDTWKFAHTHCGRLWWRIGWVMLFLSILAQLPFFYDTSHTVGIVGGIICSIQMIILVTSHFLTENALQKTFFKNDI